MSADDAMPGDGRCPRPWVPPGLVRRSCAVLAVWYAAPLAVWTAVVVWYSSRIADVEPAPQCRDVRCWEPSGGDVAGYAFLVTALLVAASLVCSFGIMTILVLLRARPALLVGTVSSLGGWLAVALILHALFS